MNEGVYLKHKNCVCSIRYKQFSNGAITPALVCDPHNIYIKWLTYQDAELLHQEHHIPIRAWRDKNKSINKTKQRLRRQQMNKYVSGQIKKIYSK